MRQVITEIRYKLPETHYLWVSAFFILYLFTYGQQLFHDFLLFDDYGTIASSHDIINVKASGRWVYYHALMFMREIFDLDSNRLLILRAISLILQLGFFTVLFYYLLIKGVDATLSFFSLLLLSSTPQFQIFSIWIVAIPYWLVLIIIILSVIWFEYCLSKSKLFLLSSWIFLFSSSLLALFVNQLLFLVVVAFVLTILMLRAINGFSSLIPLFVSGVVILSGLVFYILILSIFGENLGYTGHRSEYLSQIISNKEFDLLSEINKSRPEKAFHLYNTFMSSKAVFFIWFPMLLASVVIILKGIKKSVSGSNQAWIILPIASFFFILIITYIFPLINPHKGAYRLYLPATIMIWGFIMLAMYSIDKKVKLKSYIKQVAVFLAIGSLFSSAIAIQRGAIQPSVYELNYVKQKLLNTDLNIQTSLYLKMPQKNIWRYITQLPNESFYCLRLSTYQPWVPKGMLNYVLNRSKTPNWQNLKIQYGKKSPPKDSVVIDMEVLENIIIKTGKL